MDRTLSCPASQQELQDLSEADSGDSSQAGDFDYYHVPPAGAPGGVETYGDEQDYQDIDVDSSSRHRDGDIGSPQPHVESPDTISNQQTRLGGALSCESIVS